MLNSTVSGPRPAEAVSFFKKILAVISTTESKIIITMNKSNKFFIVFSHLYKKILMFLLKNVIIIKRIMKKIPTINKERSKFCIFSIVDGCKVLSELNLRKKSAFNFWLKKNNKIEKIDKKMTNIL